MNWDFDSPGIYIVLYLSSKKVIEHSVANCCCMLSSIFLLAFYYSKTLNESKFFFLGASSGNIGYTSFQHPDHLKDLK